LVGFLLAGFALNIMGVEGSETLDRFADFGVYLLLFSIGLNTKVSHSIPSIQFLFLLLLLNEI
jgi:predicted Kef-type K+ transport protein